MKKLHIAGWVMSVLFVAFMLFSAAGKLYFDWEKKAEDIGKLGYTLEQMTPIGILEIVIALLFLIPRTSFLAAILLTAYLGGATSTHLRVEESFIFPIIIGVFMWVAYGFRRPEIFSLAIGKAPQGAKSALSE